MQSPTLRDIREFYLNHNEPEPKRSKRQLKKRGQWEEHCRELKAKAVEEARKRFKRR